MQWFYSKEGAQQGPVSQDELTAMVASGAVRPEDLVWTDGMPAWTAAANVPELRPGGVPGLPALASANPYTPPASPPVRGGYGQPIPNYLWQAIVVTILCCPPFGIPAIVYAAKVDGLVAMGDLDGARRASDTAKMWCWISFGIVAAFLALYLLVIAVGVVAGAAGSV